MFVVSFTVSTSVQAVGRVHAGSVRLDVPVLTDGPRHDWLEIETEAARALPAHLRQIASSLDAQIAAAEARAKDTL